MAQLSEEQIAQVKKFVETFPEEEREAKLEEILGQLVAEEKKGPQCPFCLMVEGKLKTQKVLEDQEFLAVLEINPANPGHVLVFPKVHTPELNQINNLPAFFLLVNNIGTSLRGLNPGVNMLYGVGVNAGQKFGHVMAQVIPRLEKDEVVFSWKGKPLDENVLGVLREKIVAGLVKKEVKQDAPFDIARFKARLLDPKKRMP